jgi:hypothetical protein
MKYDSIAKEDKTRSDKSKTYREQGNMRIVASKKNDVKSKTRTLTIMDKE